MKLPYEILRNIGLYLNQINQKECCLVCKTWQSPFQTLVFQKAVLQNHRQADLYRQQDASLKKLTTSLHFDIEMTDDMLEEFAQASPNVHTLTLFINLLNNLSIPKTVSVLKKYWLKNLVKIRMDELILPEVLPLLSHQLEDVTGDSDSFFDVKTGKLIPMPKLKVLDLEQGEEDLPVTPHLLDDMRMAYPQLQDLTLSFFYLEPLDDEETFIYTPFPHVRSFHLKNCNDFLDSFPQIKRMFTDLTRFSFLRMNVHDRLKVALDPYKDIVTGNPNLKEMCLLYLHGASQSHTFSTLQSLNKLTSLHLERSIGTDIITKRELLDFVTLISSTPHLKKLKVYGLFHAAPVGGASFAHYLRGTVGFCDKKTVDLTRANNCVRADVIYEDIEGEDPFTTFGDGEQLYQGQDCIMTVKKKMPQLVELDERSADLAGLYEWNENSVLDAHYREPPISTPITTYPMTSLHLDWVTLRNPTYQWIYKYLPLLEEFSVLKTEPYPFTRIDLGLNVRSFTITYDARYEKYDMPVVRFEANTIETIVRWKVNKIEKMNTFQFNLFMLDISASSSLKNLSVCNRDLSPLLDEKNGNCDIS